jgi:hypothetical protein
MRDQTIDEYFNDENSMLETYTIWLDGVSAIWWLTGTHPAPWVHPKRDPGQFLTENMDYSIIGKSIENLKKVDWIGFLDDQKRGMELLKIQLLEKDGLRRKGHVGDCSDSAKCNDFGGFEMGFKNQHAHESEISVELREKLEVLLARDIYVYNFAKRLFEARYYASKTNVYVEPKSDALDPQVFEFSNQFYKKILNTL